MKTTAALLCALALLSGTQAMLQPQAAAPVKQEAPSSRQSSVSSLLNEEVPVQQAEEAPVPVPQAPVVPAARKYPAPVFRYKAARDKLRALEDEGKLPDKDSKEVPGISKYRLNPDFALEINRKKLITQSHFPEHPSWGFNMFYSRLCDPGERQITAIIDSFNDFAKEVRQRQSASKRTFYVRARLEKARHAWLMSEILLGMSEATVIWYESLYQKGRQTAMTDVSKREPEPEVAEEKKKEDSKDPEYVVKGTELQHTLVKRLRLLNSQLLLLKAQCLIQYNSYELKNSPGMFRSGTAFDKDKYKSLLKNFALRLRDTLQSLGMGQTWLESAMNQRFCSQLGRFQNGGKR